MADTITNTTLKKLEDLYREGNIEAFKDQLIKNRDNLSDGLFHYNLGTAFAKSGDLAAARYNYEKALKFGYEHPALKKNLKLVTSQVEQSVPESEDIQAMMTKNFVFGSESLFLFVALILSLFFVGMKRFKLINNKIIITVLVLLSFTPYLTKKFYYNKKYLTGINLKKVQILEGPSDIYPALKELEAGQKIILSKSFDDYVFIAWPIDYAGWIERSKLGLL